MNLVYVAPAERPVTVDPWPGLRHVLVMPDGDRIDITDWRRSGVLLTDDGTRGLTRPEWTMYHAESPIVHGARYLGHNAPMREVRLPLLIWNDDSSPEWTRHYRRFMQQMRPDRVIVWEVSEPDTGETRRLRMRFTGPEDDSVPVDPRSRGWWFTPLLFVADDQPFWEGGVISRYWSSYTGGQDFIDPVELAPPFYLSRAVTLDNAQVSNPGDEDVWPVWTITAATDGGGIDNWSVGVGDRTVGGPISLAPGEWVEVDTRPGRKTVYDNEGVRRTPELTERQWARIRSGERVPLSISMLGDGDIRVTLTPLFHEAY